MRASAVGLALALLACACEGRPRAGQDAARAAAPGRAALAVFDLTAGAPEQPAGNMLGLGRHGAFADLVRSLEEVAADGDVRAAFVELGPAHLGMARASELGRALGALRRAGRPVVCHAHSLTNATLFAVASGCSKVWVSPAGDVDASGLSAQVVYMRRLLVDELHLGVDILQIGKFKGASEPLTRDGPSDEARASLEGMLTDMRTSWLGAIGAGRAPADAARVAEDGPYSAASAKDRGLVDDVGYADDARAAAKREVDASREVVRFGVGSAAPDHEDFTQLVRSLTPEASTAPIAVVVATGSISMGRGGGIGTAGGIVERELRRTLAKIERNEAIKAVVLRIDSPGGSALASDLLWHQLMKLRAKKPIVASVGDMAASGGYYLASASSAVVAEPTSIVGSIGVVGGKISLGSAIERVGVHTETFTAAPSPPGAASRAAYLSALVAWDAPTRSRVFDAMKAVYDLFLRRVAEGRQTTVDAIAPSAEGRIFSGREAKTRGLVDEIGGLQTAIGRARQLAKLPATAPYSVVGVRSTLLDMLAGGDDGDDGQATRALPQHGVVRGALEVIDSMAPELVPFTASLAPLWAEGGRGGERVLTTLPFALVIR